MLGFEKLLSAFSIAHRIFLGTLALVLFSFKLFLCTLKIGFLRFEVFVFPVAVVFVLFVFFLVGREVFNMLACLVVGVLGVDVLYMLLVVVFVFFCQSPVFINAIG